MRSCELLNHCSSGNSSLVINRLCSEARELNAAVGCLYCDYRGQKEQTAEVMIGSLLKQFLRGLPEIPVIIRQAFQAARTQLGGRELELAELVGLFPAVLRRFKEVFICVDALDEFIVGYRPRFLRSLCQIVDKSPKVRIFLTARPHIQSELGSGAPPDMGIITVQPSLNDIEKYLVEKLDADPHLAAMDTNLRSEIMTKILRESSKM